MSVSVGSSWRTCRWTGLVISRRYSPLVGVGVDEVGEESEEVDKLAVVYARQVKPIENWRGGEKKRASARRVEPGRKQMAGRCDLDCRGGVGACPESILH